VAGGWARTAPSPPGPGTQAARSPGGAPYPCQRRCARAPGPPDPTRLTGSLLGAGPRAPRLRSCRSGPTHLAVPPGRSHPPGSGIRGPSRGHRLPAPALRQRTPSAARSLLLLRPRPRHVTPGAAPSLRVPPREPPGSLALPAAGETEAPQGCLPSYPATRGVP
jgi:hypothetical protein